jgi:hypothetical protein
LAAAVVPIGPGPDGVEEGRLDADADLRRPTRAETPSRIEERGRPATEEGPQWRRVVQIRIVGEIDAGAMGGRPDDAAIELSMPLATPEERAQAMARMVRHAAKPPEEIRREIVEMVDQVADGDLRAVWVTVDALVRRRGERDR